MDTGLAMRSMEVLTKELERVTEQRNALLKVCKQVAEADAKKSLADIVDSMYEIHAAIRQVEEN
jgi:hypothetical protein